MIDVQLVIPCFNEQARLEMDRFRRFATESQIHLLFVDDGSTDGTGAILSQAQRSSPEILSTLVLPNNQGKAEAVRQGLLQAMQNGAQIVGFADADLAVPEKELARLAALAKGTGTKVLLGSRVRLLGFDIQRRPVRHYIGRVFATLASMALQLPVYDTQCGAKFFHCNGSLRAALQRPFVSPWLLDIELIGRLLTPLEPHMPRLVLPDIQEVPLQTWHEIPGSKVRPIDGIRACWGLARIARDLRQRRGREKCAGLTPQVD